MSAVLYLCPTRSETNCKARLFDEPDHDHAPVKCPVHNENMEIAPDTDKELEPVSPPILDPDAVLPPKKGPNAPKEEDEEDYSYEDLAAQYEELTGEEPDGRWGAPRLAKEVSKLKADQ